MNRRRGVSMVLILLISVLAAACRSSTSPTATPGETLAAAAPSTWGVRGVAPGHRFVLMLGSLLNESDDEIVIQRVEAIRTTGVPDVAKVVSMELVPRGGVHPPISMGRYVVYPPAMPVPKGNEFERFPSVNSCWIQDVKPSAGFLLSPSEDPAERALLVTAIRANKPGRAEIGAQRVVYEREGQTFEEIIPLRIVVGVRSGPESSIPADQKRCIGPAQALNG